MKSYAVTMTLCVGSLLFASCSHDLDSVTPPGQDQGPAEAGLDKGTTKPDAPRPDKGPKPDSKVKKDVALPDAPKPDKTKPKPDKMLPDKMLPDKTKPKPDKMLPDKMLPDKMIPDMAMCIVRFWSDFNNLSGWVSGSLIFKNSASGYTKIPSASGGVYKHTSTSSSGQGGHHRALASPINGARFLISATVSGDKTKAMNGLIRLGAMYGNTMTPLPANPKVTRGIGYSCNYYAPAKQVSVTRHDGGKSAVDVARSKYVTGSSNAHSVSCERLQDGSWVLTMDGKKLSLDVNKKDLTYKKLPYISTLIPASSTKFTVDKLTYEGCP